MRRHLQEEDGCERCSSDANTREGRRDEEGEEEGAESRGRMAGRRQAREGRGSEIA